MCVTVEVSGLNLERLLSVAANEGIILKHVERTDCQKIRLVLSYTQKEAFKNLCARFGWKAEEIGSSLVQRCICAARRRPIIVVSIALYIAIMLISSSMILQVRIDHAGKDIAEVRRYLMEEGIGYFRLKTSISVSKLRDELMLRLPGVSHVSVTYEGSRLVIDCQPSLEGELALHDGAGMDVVASQDGIITGIVVQSGTPVVSIGQAVCAGDVLIRGTERGEKGSLIRVQASGNVTARVWVRGDARVSRVSRRTVETGDMRRRVAVCTPWYRKLVRDAPSFEKQDVSKEVVPVVGLYLPLWREIETLAEIEIITEERNTSDAVSMAQGAAEQAAKNKCPSGVHILDKTVENSMIDTEYVYSAVVLEYESSIAVTATRDNDEEMIQ